MSCTFLWEILWMFQRSGNILSQVLCFGKTFMVEKSVQSTLCTWMRVLYDHFLLSLRNPNWHHLSKKKKKAPHFPYIPKWEACTSWASHLTTGGSDGANERVDIFCWESRNKFWGSPAWRSIEVEDGKVTPEPGVNRGRHQETRWSWSPFRAHQTLPIARPRPESGPRSPAPGSQGNPSNLRLHTGTNPLERWWSSCIPPVWKFGTQVW